MVSSLACIGFDVADLDELGGMIQPMTAEVVGRAGEVITARYADPSGARLLISRREGTPVDLVASYSAAPGALLAAASQTPEGHTIADLVDDDGRVLTRLRVDLEQHRQLGDEPRSLHVSLVALGVEMAVYADHEAFAASPASHVGDAAGPQWSAESFVSYGVLHDADGSELAEPTGFLAGTVLECTTQENAASGQSFHAARVRSAGFEATVCLAASEFPTAPEPGNVVAGSCYLVADAPQLWSPEVPPGQRKWWRPTAE